MTDGSDYPHMQSIFHYLKLGLIGYPLMGLSGWFLSSARMGDEWTAGFGIVVGGGAFGLLQGWLADSWSAYSGWVLRWLRGLGYLQLGLFMLPVVWATNGLRYEIDTLVLGAAIMAQVLAQMAMGVCVVGAGWRAWLAHRSTESQLTNFYEGRGFTEEEQDWEEGDD